jgi:hypothetical protein
MKDKDKKENENGFESFSMESYILPIISESYNKDWINFGEDNQYPEYLLDLYRTSPKNAAMLNTISDMISGEGIVGGSDAMKANIYDDDDLETIVTKVSMDLAIYNAFALNIIWSRDGAKVAQIKFVDVSTVRFSKEENGYYVSKDWGNTRKQDNKPVWVAKFNPNDDINKSQLLYVPKYSPSMSYYSIPSYVSAIGAIELDREIQRYNLQNAKNNFYPSMNVQVNSGIPSKEERQTFKRQLEREFSGTENAGKMIVTFANNKDTATDFTPIEINASTERFIEIDAKILQAVLMANGAVNPELFGIAVPGSLGAATELAESFEVYQKKVISSYQKLIEKTLNKISVINGEAADIKIDKYKIVAEIAQQENNDTQTLND